MNRNAVIFVLASLGVLIGWNYMMEGMYPQPAPVPKEGAPAAAQPASATQPSAPAASPGKPLAPAPVPAVIQRAPEQLVAVETEAYEAELSTWGARFVRLRLKGVTYKGADGVEAPLDLVDRQDQPRYGSLELPGMDLSQGWVLLTPRPAREGGAQVVRFLWRSASSPLQLEKAFRFEDQGHRYGVSVKAVNAGVQPLSLGPLGLLWGPNLGGGSSGIGMYPPAGVVQLDGRIERERASGETKVLGYAKPRWVALKNHYFVVGYFPSVPAWNRAEIRQLGNDRVVTALVAEGLSLQAGESVALGVEAYAGPQDYGALKAIGNNFQRVVQFQYYQVFDWLNPLSIGLLHVLQWFHAVTGNWGVAIILLTLLVRGILFWPSLKSMVSMRRMQTKMAAMQPRLETIKKVYKDDPNKLNQEMMKLYKEYGVNPLGGCLPMLLQIPVFFALYGTLIAAFELRGASFVWKWTDLTAGDPTHIFPLAMGLTMFLQQKLAPVSATMSEEQVQMQKMMLWLFPIMFTGMALFMAWPVGLLIYWTASNVFGILQQLAVNKAVD